MVCDTYVVVLDNGRLGGSDQDLSGSGYQNTLERLAIDGRQALSSESRSARHLGLNPGSALPIGDFSITCRRGDTEICQNESAIHYRAVNVFWVVVAFVEQFCQFAALVFGVKSIADAVRIYRSRQRFILLEKIAA
jgi:hypothetical protein